ncbi:MAG TPA: efflux RND transporter periplasmic adaptor subunit, partial [Verrucomicrobiae bacterium]|nr:efflux RND transporter periplasmic adaptor subunit [Verrucomicrobiae bacterium]
REEGLYHQGVEAVQAYDQARTSLEGAKARVQSLEHQVNSSRATVALARSNSEQVAARRAALAASRHQMAAAAAQKQKAEVRLNYTEIHAPTNGIVDVRAALEGEVVNPGQAIVTLANPDDFWVRADVEETYIDRIHLGDRLSVRLPSGATREGTVFYRAVDADYATQRDVSRTKRDIKTFEVRLRCDNRDRSLALGMTAYVTLVLGR